MKFEPDSFDPYFYRRDGIGTNIQIIDFMICLDNSDLKDLNEGINNSLIFIYSEPVGGKGGLGGVYIPPATIEIFEIVVKEIVVDIFAAFAYEVFKNAIKKIFNKIKEKKGNPKTLCFKLRHKDNSILIVIRGGVVDDELLDLSLRNLLSDVKLRETPINGTDSNDDTRAVG